MNGLKLALGAVAAVAIATAVWRMPPGSGSTSAPATRITTRRFPRLTTPCRRRARVDPGPPPEYVEGSRREGDANLWYYCDASKHYYPYVKTCKSGWRSVPARPQ